MARPGRTQRIVATLVVGVGLSFAVVAPPASASAPRPDSDAPAGAPADWLPHEEWVGQRWLPFDEQVLERKLKMSATDVWTHLSATRTSLNTLARSRGVSTTGLAARLVSARHVPRHSRRWRVLYARTRRVLDQPHLGAHMLGHIFHVWAVTAHTKQTLGVTGSQFKELYGERHLSFLQVAAAAGVDEATLRSRVMAASRGSGAQGVAKGAMSARENRILRARDAASFESWANYRVPGQAIVTHGFLCHFASS
jgi:hypothetical protein